MDTSGSKELQLRALSCTQLSSEDNLGCRVLPEGKNLNVRCGKDLIDQPVLPYIVTSCIFPSDFSLFQAPRLLATPSGRCLHIFLLDGVLPAWHNMARSHLGFYSLIVAR